ncbi:MAG TPA: hypothetical protein VFR71_03865 [Methyloceanibacter sp.]|nr:hypothetical protein [Methyloceanibacter sp.]
MAALNKFPVDVRKKSITASSSKDGELVTSTMTSAPLSVLSDALAGEAVDTGRRRSRQDLVSARLEVGCKLAADQAGSTDDDDFHFQAPLNEFYLAVDI